MPVIAASMVSLVFGQNDFSGWTIDLDNIEPWVRFLGEVIAVASAVWLVIRYMSNKFEGHVSTIVTAVVEENTKSIQPNGRDESLPKVFDRLDEQDAALAEQQQRLAEGLAAWRKEVKAEFASLRDERSDSQKAADALITDWISQLREQGIVIKDDRK